MNSILNRYKELLCDQSGILAIDSEMNHQAEDVLRTEEEQRSMIHKLAEAIRACPQVLLLGMGASHFVNEVFAFQIRKNGIDAIAMTASEFLYDPIPVKGKIVILTSQSGESAETVKCMNILDKTVASVYSVTLTKESTIAKGTQALVCSGGGEKAFAGTRSVTLSIAAFAFVAAELSELDSSQVEIAVRTELLNQESIEKAVWLLYAKQTIIATGRGLFSPLSNLFALGCEELGTKVVLCNESGTFRHGPMEVLDSGTALVVFRQSGPLGKLCESFNEVQAKSNCTLIVIDASGMEPLENASVTIPCPQGEDIIAVLGAMNTFQTLMIAYACGKNPRTGLPRYGSKVTRTE